MHCCAANDVMRFCYQVATPDVAINENVTALQGSIEETFGAAARSGYDGVELMTLSPSALDRAAISRTAQDLGICIDLVCTGEVYGQLGLSFTDPDPSIRTDAICHVQEIIQFAAFFGAKINIGRVRGQYRGDIPRQQTEEWAIDAFRQISDYAAPLGVPIALETVTIMQTNFINTLAQARDILRRVDRENFRLMMDIFHLNIEEPDLFKAIQMFSADNIHVHLSDNNRRYPGNCGMDFARVIRTFHDCGYDGSFCVEVYQMPDIETALRHSASCLAPIFEDVYGRPANRL